MRTTRTPEPALAVCAVEIAACFAAGAAAASSTTLDVGAGIRVHKSVRTLKDLRDENVVKQRYDYSCGSAALATLLQFGFGESVT